MEPAHLHDDFVDPTAERALIAAAAREGTLYFELIDRLPEKAFHVEAAAWSALSTAAQANKPWSVPDNWVPADDPLATADRLADLWRRRQVADLQEQVGAAMDDHGRPTMEILALLEDGLTRIQGAIRDERVGRAVPVPDLFGEVLEDLERRRAAFQEGRPVGLPSGIPALDQRLGGFQPGLHAFGGSPGVGKTSLALQWAGHIARTGVPVIFVTYDETPARLALKALCQTAGLVTKTFAEGRGDPQEIESVMRDHAVGLLPLYLLEGTATLSVANIRTKALAAMAQHKAPQCLIVVDYLQRVAAGRKDFSEFRHVISSLTGELRELALRLKSPVLALSSLNREHYNKPAMEGLKESGDIEFSADSVLLLTEPEEQQAIPPTKTIELTVAKNRFGETGKVSLIFRPDLGTMQEEAR